MSKRIFRIGTRKSIMAIAQAKAVRHAMLSHFPNLLVELHGVETKADESQMNKFSETPLWKLEGKNFFVAEIDEALLRGETDLSVHSLKDLSLTRPPQFHTPFILPRHNPQDAILFGPNTKRKLEKGAPLIIGTSSLRRIENTPRFLEKALPHLNGHTPQIEMKPIRGNAHSRIARMFEDESSDRYVDAVVLAFAGLIKLWEDEDGQNAIRDFLAPCRWMILPLSQCPAAPGQGTLAVECRQDDHELTKILAKLHDEATAATIAKERDVLARYGGGCHQKFGATAINVPSLDGEVLFIHGQSDAGQDLDEISWDAPIPETKINNACDTHDYRRKAQPHYQKTDWEKINGAVFVAHERAVPDDHGLTMAHRIWTSGTASWFALARKGLWVEGCADNLGFQTLVPILAEDILQLPEDKDWHVLTHDEALDDWPTQQVTATYRLEETDHPQLEDALPKASHIYWSSASLFARYHHLAAPTAHHACGPGKTAAKLRAQKLTRFAIFPNRRAWQEWLAMPGLPLEKLS